MSYTPTTWAAGDTVTAAKLNKLEQGVASSGGGVLVVHDVNRTLDKTYAEIKAASNKGIVVLLDENSNVLYLSGAYFEYGTYYASFFGDQRAEFYETDSENGYPALP